jgi:hypothetical protein
VRRRVCPRTDTVMPVSCLVSSVSVFPDTNTQDSRRSNGTARAPALAPTGSASAAHS